MDEPSAPSFWDAVQQSAAAAFVGESVWAYPALEIVHVLGIALVFGPILIFDLRVLGLYRDVDLSRLHRILLPWVWTGFALNAASGALMFVSDAAEFAANTAFRFKLALIAVAALNAVAFQKRWFPAIGGADDPKISFRAKASAGASIALWLAIISAGRLMAYVK
jgi:hypothetical protein